MRLLPVMLRSMSGMSSRCSFPWMSRALSSNMGSGDASNGKNNGNSYESADDFERRIFSGFLDNSPNTDSFYQKLDRLERARGRPGSGYGMNDGDNSQFIDGLDESFNTLSDGMDGKLKKAATYFTYSDEIKDDDYAYRPDVSFRPGMQYDTKDLDLTKPGVRKSFKRQEFETTTEEVLRKADFRALTSAALTFLAEADDVNVRFLANFITEAGIIIKRKQTKISAKAQRKVAREIKIARAFGLMPFTTMGTKRFVFGRTMEDRDQDYEVDDYNYTPQAPLGTDPKDDPILGL